MTTHEIVIDARLWGREMYLRLTGPGYPDLGVDDINRALSNLPGMETVKLSPPTTVDDSLEIELTNIDAFMAMNDRFIKQLVTELLTLVGNGASATVIDVLYRHAFEARIMHVPEALLAVYGLRPLTSAEVADLQSDADEPSLEEALADYLQTFSRRAIIRICAEAYQASPRKTNELLSRKYRAAPSRSGLSELLEHLRRYLS